MPTDNLDSNKLDQVTTRVLDFHQRRITNAHPSIDDYDYVVRKELRRFLTKDSIKELSEVSILVIEDTHNNRFLHYPPSAYTIGTIYFETDNKVFLLNQVLSGLQFWIPYWNNPIYSIHQDRAGVTPPVYYPNGTITYETDRLVSYMTKPQIGYVNTNGTTVTLSIPPLNATWEEMQGWDSTWISYPVNINGSWYYIVDVPDSQTLILSTSAGVHAGDDRVPYSMPSGQWNYHSGTYLDDLDNRPNDLVKTDVNYLFQSKPYAPVGLG